MSALLKQFIELKNFPQLTSIVHNEDKIELSLMLNQYTKVGVGPIGAFRYYVLENLTFRVISYANGSIHSKWGQPKDQITFILRDPNSIIVDSNNFKNRVRNQFKLIADDKNLISPFIISDIETVLDKKNLHAWIMKIMTPLAHSFWLEVPDVIIEDNFSINGYTAYVDGAIHLSLSKIKDLHSLLMTHFDEKQSLMQLNRNLIGILIQEWVHLLQQKLSNDLYQPNFSFYNNPDKAYLMFGEVGINQWYHEQPIEIDAHDLAGDFVESLFK